MVKFQHPLKYKIKDLTIDKNLKKTKDGMITFLNSNV